ncbi:extracellular solute-binding protein [Mesorhizobium sp. CO1-1-8]|nr:extracellular solute-binding protein [Mesorhizobium sp. CO1-1-8]
MKNGKAFNTRLGRRTFLKIAGGAAAGILFAPAIVRGATAGQVYIRTSGGSAEEGYKRAWYDPLLKDTGIEVVPTVIDPAKIVAMVLAGNVTLDITAQTAPELTIMARKGILERIDYGRFTRTNKDDLDEATEFWLVNTVYATVLGYNSAEFGGKHPGSWKDVWDVSAFPGRRMLQDAAAEYPNLEQALLADGVSIDKLYPLDVDRAFKMLGAIRGNVVKWWDSGAVSAQLLSDKVAVMGSIWESRANPLIAEGAPIAIEWNQAMRNIWAMGIIKGAPNTKLAYTALDYGSSPVVQAAIAREVLAAPGNRRAFEHLEPAVAAGLSTAPEHAKLGFVNNAAWWVDNLDMVRERWREFLLQ